MLTFDIWWFRVTASLPTPLFLPPHLFSLLLSFLFVPFPSSSLLLNVMEGKKWRIDNRYVQHCHKKDGHWQKQHWLDYTEGGGIFVITLCFQLIYTLKIRWLAFIQGLYSAYSYFLICIYLFRYGSKAATTQLDETYVASAGLSGESRNRLSILPNGPVSAATSTYLSTFIMKNICRDQRQIMVDSKPWHFF